MMMGRSRGEELEAFKMEINLSEFAASRGYVLDVKASSRNSAVMRHRNGDKIIIARGEDRHWTYFSILDSTDNGTVIDFLQNRGGGNIGEVRKILRDWTPSGGRPQGQETGRNADPIFSGDLEPITKDLVRVRAEFHRCVIPVSFSYLERVREIPAAILNASKFSGRILVDERQNTIFPHWNREGISGFEIKNENFTGFSPGGEKGLWCSRAKEGESILIITETAIDALSYAALKGEEKMRYVSTGGGMSPSQVDLLRSAFQKLPAQGQVILAFDHDRGGEKLAREIEAIFQEVQYDAFLNLRRDQPEQEGEDWNDVLRSRS